MKRYAKKVAKKAQAPSGRLRREIESDEHNRQAAARRGAQGGARGRRGGRLVAALRDVTAVWDGEPLLRDVDITIHGRDRIAITGP